MVGEISNRILSAAEKSLYRGALKLVRLSLYPILIGELAGATVGASQLFHGGPHGLLFLLAGIITLGLTLMCWNQVMESTRPPRERHS